VKTPRKASSSFGRKLGGRAKVEARDYPSLDYVKRLFADVVFSKD
jgi:hypothetical protein